MKDIVDIHLDPSAKRDIVSVRLHLPEILPVMHITLSQYFLNERLLGRIFYF